MYPGDPTHTEELIEVIKEGKPLTEDIVKQMVDKHVESTKGDDEGVPCGIVIPSIRRLRIQQRARSFAHADRLMTKAS